MTFAQMLRNYVLPTPRPAYVRPEPWKPQQSRPVDVRPPKPTLVSAGGNIAEGMTLLYKSLAGEHSVCARVHVLKVKGTGTDVKAYVRIDELGNCGQEAADRLTVGHEFWASANQLYEWNPDLFTPAG